MQMPEPDREVLARRSEIVADLRASVPVFHPQPAALSALTARIKESFDPKGSLNPGRIMMGG